MTVKLTWKWAGGPDHQKGTYGEYVARIWIIRKESGYIDKVHLQIDRGENILFHDPCITTIRKAKSMAKKIIDSQ